MLGFVCMVPVELRTIVLAARWLPRGSMAAGINEDEMAVGLAQVCMVIARRRDGCSFRLAVFGFESLLTHERLDRAVTVAPELADHARRWPDGRPGAYWGARDAQVVAMPRRKLCGRRFL
jgi:hypothetical protein